MDQTTMIGSVVLTIITLGSFIAVIQKFTKPIKDIESKIVESFNNFTLAIQKLNFCVEGLEKSLLQVIDRLNRHSSRIEEVERKLSNMETRMNVYHKE